MFREKNYYVLGVLAALATVTIWAAFLIGTRFAVSGNLTVDEVLVLRLVPAFLIMIPLMLKLGVIIKGQSIFSVLMIALGATAVFPYLISTGVYYAPASDAGALAPGMLPFWTALFAFLITGEKPSKIRLIGLIVILLGALLVGSYSILSSGGQNTWKGHFLFLTGAGMWSVYSVYFRQSGIDPLTGLVFGLFWGTAVVIPLLFLFGDVSFAKATTFDIYSMIILQGLLIAILAMLLYNFSIRQLGPAQTAAFGALTPILALVGGFVFLGEPITLLKSIGIFIVAVGVVLASGIMEKALLAMKK
ncbi:MAG: DMT family transporter [Paracoccaceae bacterium]